MYYFLWLNITNILPMPLPPSTYFLDRKATSWKEKEKHKGVEEKEAKTFPLSLFFPFEQFHYYHYYEFRIMMMSLKGKG